MPGSVPLLRGSLLSGSLLSGSLLSGYAVLTVLVWVRLSVLDRFDRSLASSVRGFAEPVARAVTRTGDTLPLVLLGVLVVTVLLVLRRYRETLMVLAATAVASALSRGVKAAMQRPRPEGHLTGASGWAYPSGHSTNATLAAAMLAVLILPLLRAGWQKVVLVTVLAAWAVAVGVSRVVLSVHWPTDVLGGWLVGLGSVSLVTYWAAAVRAGGGRGRTGHEPP